jgi:7-cyano-7-deazaguanine synthase
VSDWGEEETTRESRRQAVVLLSGGLDSAVVAAIARDQGFDPIALSFDYGQRHAIELEAARRVARSLALADHRVVKVDLAAIGGSALTAPAIAVPKAEPGAPVDSSRVPITYVPARNTIFLALALGLAESAGASDLFFGANALDYSGYPDCRPEFIAAFEALANLGTREAVEGRLHFNVHAPLVSMTKAEIVRQGVALGVDLSLTHSCYDPIGDRACGRCDACRLRRKGFEDAGVPDPTAYAER